MSDLTAIPLADLEAELERRHLAAAQQERADAIARIRTLNLRGFTVKDMVVELVRLCNDEDLRFSFHLHHDGKDHDLYYGWNDWREGELEMVPHDWWPASRDDRGEWENDALQFIPPGFREESENSYGFRGTDDEAIACLRAAGYENVMVEEDEG